MFKLLGVVVDETLGREGCCDVRYIGMESTWDTGRTGRMWLERSQTGSRRHRYATTDSLPRFPLDALKVSHTAASVPGHGAMLTGISTDGHPTRSAPDARALELPARSRWPPCRLVLRSSSRTLRTRCA